MLIDTAKALRDHFFEVIKAWDPFDKKAFEDVYIATEKASQIIVLIQDRIYQLEQKKKDLIAAQDTVRLRVQ
jgi:hypothetical protein